MKPVRPFALLAFVGLMAGAGYGAQPSVWFVTRQAAAGDLVLVRVAGVRPGRARLALVPGGVTLDPTFRVGQRGTARFRATVPNVVPGRYKLAVMRSGRLLARSSRNLRIVDPPPRIRGCENSQYGDLDPTWERGALRAGPVAFGGMADGVSAEYVARFRNVVKVLLVVNTGTVVTLRVVQADRHGVALDYTSGRPSRRVADGRPAMTFRACPPTDSRPHTQFGGTFVLDGPRCARLVVQVQGQEPPIPVALRFGAPCG